jgi:hypothetical protein
MNSWGRDIQRNARTNFSTHQAVRYHIEAANEALKHSEKLKIVNVSGKSVMEEITDTYIFKLERKLLMRA